MPRNNAHARWVVVAFTIVAGLARAETISRNEAEIAVELANPLAPVTTLTTESTYNWQASPANRWTVPLDASVAKVVDAAGAFFNVGAGFVEYVRRPSCAPERELRPTATYVFG
jgi:hypothetical protein